MRKSRLKKLLTRVFPSLFPTLFLKRISEERPWRDRPLRTRVHTAGKGQKQDVGPPSSSSPFHSATFCVPDPVLGGVVLTGLSGDRAAFRLGTGHPVVAKSGQPQQDQEVKIRAVRRRGRPDGGRGSDPSLGRPASCLAASDLVLSPGCWAGLVLTPLALSGLASPSCQPASCPGQRKASARPGPLRGSRPASRRAPGQEVPKEGRESPGRMSAQGAGHSTGGGCDEAAALGPEGFWRQKEGSGPGL